MTDWHRMEWQWKANVWATRVRVLCILLLAPEVLEAVRYHFPLWDDLAMPVTLIAHQVCLFVQRHTDEYRIDL